jgi:CRISPR-associated protein (TIGR02584 family)
LTEPLSGQPPQRVLLITTGSTPQVVTETLHALVSAPSPWIPERLLLATTGEGARLFRDGRAGFPPLLGSSGRLAACAAALGLPPDFAQIEVLVPGEAEGEPFRDIRNEAEVLGFAELLMRQVAAITACPDTELHVSLAGGRKTMSFLAGQVMSLLGRPQDRLSHVLVEPASLEAPDSGFWWPGDGSPASASGRVFLHDVAFLRTRAWFDAGSLSAMMSGGYAQAVARANAALGATTLVVDLGLGRIEVAGQHVRLEPAELAVVALAGIAAKRGTQVTTVPHLSDPAFGEPIKCQALALGEDRLAATALWAWLRHAAALDAIYEGDEVVHFGRFDEAIAREVEAIERKGEAGTRILPRISKAQGRLKSALPPSVAKRVLVKRHRRLGTAFDPAGITVRAPAALVGHPQWPGEVDVSEGPS